MFKNSHNSEIVKKDFYSLNFTFSPCFLIIYGNIKQRALQLLDSVQFGLGPDVNLSTQPDLSWQPGPNILKSSLSSRSQSGWTKKLIYYILNKNYT